MISSEFAEKMENKGIGYVKYIIGLVLDKLQCY